MLVLFVEKFEEKIRFYVDYKRLNTITKKDCYPILFIKKILVQLESAKYFIKIDICQTFYYIRMSKDSKKLTIFLTKFGIFKYLIILFDLYNGPASWQYFVNDTLFDFFYYFV